MTKSEHELSIFRAFTEAAGLAVPPESIQSQSPPAPDVRCVVSGDLRFFELTRAADQGMADDVGQLLAEGRRTGQGGVGEVHTYDDRQILRATVEKKAAKTHETGGVRCDLLVYYDGVFHALAAPDLIRATLAELRERHRLRWGYIWVFDLNKRAVVA